MFLNRSAMKMKRQKLQWVIALFSVAVLSSCWNNHRWENLHPGAVSSAANCDTSAVVSYSATVQPIINQSCATSGCHVSHGGVGASNYTIFSNVATDGTSGVLMQRIDLPLSDGAHMPQGGGFLNACDTLQIRKWIHQGCPQN
jgi:hypothetical protein